MAEPEDDLVAGSLRSVFSAMRAADEEPPMHGLAALMAAATAGAPKRLTWWQRLNHALRQPPVLALASGAILIGGAVLIWGAHVISRPGAPREAVAPRGAPIAPVVVAPRASSPRVEVTAAASAPGVEHAMAAATVVHTPPLTPEAAQRTSSELAPQTLFVQASAAAARGDCETARTLATRVARQAPAYYRNHVVTDAAVATCLNPR